MTMRWISLGAFIDLGDLGITHEALHMVFLDIAVTTVYLHCFHRGAHGSSLANTWAILEAMS